MKKSLLLLVMMLLPMVASADVVEIDGIYYDLKPSTKTSLVVSNPNKYSGDIVIPESVTYDGTEYSVTTIGIYSFVECTGLTSITFPNSITEIQSGAFIGCTGLTSFDIPSSVTLVSMRILEGCTGLTSIVIPENVTLIGSCAFNKCSSLKSIKVLSKNPPEVIDGAFDNYDIPLYVPGESLKLYKSAEVWKKFKTISSIEGGEVPECAKPTISYENGEIVFGCDTEGVEFVSEITVPDGKKYNTSKISLTTTYNVTVYATKSGYQNSDPVSKDIDVRGEKGDVNGDGKVSITDAVNVVNIILKGEGNTPETPEKDTTPPVISAEGISVNPVDCQVYQRGSVIPFNYVFTDDKELGAYNIEIHNNFDHHTHASSQTECSLDGVKSPQNPWIFNQNYTIPVGQQSYTSRVDIQIPTDIDAGDYHLMIRLTDCAGWQQLHAVSIKIQ